MLDTHSLQLIAHTIRGLSIDAIEAAGCGHPGLPLGCAELAAYLYGYALDHDPQRPEWINRDKFVLSAGHGSMLLYASLHLAGFSVGVEDLKQFRKYHAITPGHPEYKETPGVETTTGPLGQGIATSVGLALAQKMAQSQFKLETLLNSKVVVLAGDGCMMEGVSAEAASFAGHLKLDNLILIYDANNICLDGPIEECFSDNTAQRFQSYGWDVQTIDGHNFDQIHTAYQKAKQVSGKPQLIIAKTVIGKGSPHYAGTAEVHGKALGKEEAALTKQALGIPLEPLFDVPESVKTYFGTHLAHQKQAHEKWMQDFQSWAVQNPELAARLTQFQDKKISLDLETVLKNIDLKSGIATRQASGIVLQTLHNEVPFLVGGSADLSCSDNTWMKAAQAIAPGVFDGRNIKYGVREFAMGAIASGLALHGMFLPYCGTFFTFSDYMRNAIRLAALMKLKVIYQFTHDSIFLGEDGPTHQPVEHLASLRAMPHLVVIRPADNTEVKGAWFTALSLHQPCALVFSRQGVPALESTRFDGVARGAYILKRETKPEVDFALLATGSEVALALEVSKKLEEKGFITRVISFPSFELFNQQDKAYQDTVLGGNVAKYVSIEAQVSFGWHQYIGRDGVAIAVNDFGLSAPAADLARHFGFTVEQILAKVLA